MTYDVRKDRQLILENEHMISAGRHEIAGQFETPAHGRSLSLVQKGLPVSPVSPAVRAEAMRKVDHAIHTVQSFFKTPVMFAVTLVSILLSVAEFLVVAKEDLHADSAGLYDKFKKTIESIGIGATTSRILSVVFWGAIATLGARVFVNYLYKSAEAAVNKAERQELTSQEQDQVDELNQQLVSLQKSMSRLR